MYTKTNVRRKDLHGAGAYAKSMIAHEWEKSDSKFEEYNIECHKEGTESY